MGNSHSEPETGHHRWSVFVRDPQDLQDPRNASSDSIGGRPILSGKAGRDISQVMTLVAIIDVIRISFLTFQSEYNPNPNLNQKVVFKLHPDFVPTIITVAKPPYEVHRHHSHIAVKHILNPIMGPSIRLLVS